MKWLKRLSAIAVSTVMILSITSMNVFAASNTQDGLEISLTTDKEAYTQDEKITATLAVKNTTESAITNIDMETVIPDGYELTDGTKNSKQLDKLAPNEAVELKAVCVAKLKGEVNKDNEISIINSSNYSPRTGDNAMFTVVVLIMLASVSLAVFCFKSKKGSKFLSVMLTVSILGSSAITMSVKTNAADVSKMIELQETVKVADDAVVLKSIVKYHIIVDNSEKDISINTDSFTYSSAENRYYVNEETKTFSGSLKHSDKYQTIEYDAFDEKGKHVDHDSIPASEDWSFENIGLVAGINTVKVKATGTQSAEEQICLYDPFGYNYYHLENANVDTDKDGLFDYVENILGTDINKQDSDGDNISDYQEAVVLGTDPLKTDTDGNGVSDYDDDEDKDGISNGEEIKLGLNPVGRDTDNDDINDYDELYKYHTDPLKTDTDGDKADDKWEIDNGFDPLTPQETFDVTKQSESLDLTASVQTVLQSQKAMTLSVEEDTDNPYLPKSIPGYLGNPFNFSVEGELEQPATISFKLPEDMDLNDVEPVIYYFNEETKQLEEIKTEIDYENGIAKAKVSHFSTYILLNKREFDSVWNEDIRKPNEEVPDRGLAIAFVIDRSASMDDNDASYLRTQLTKNFIDKLDGDKDEGSVISFIAVSEVLTELTNDKNVLKNAVDTIVNDSGYNSNSGTNGSAGIKSALGQLEADIEDHDKYIVFMTDGEDNRRSYSYDSLIKEANDNGVTIYTIGLGSVDDSTLKKVAQNTGGKYYYASEASELISIFEQAERETIDYITDTNNDGISDYYTRIMCEGEQFINGAYNPFWGYSFEEIQNGNPYDQESSKEDYDGDGLKNGEEIIITTGQERVYVQMISNPTKINSDGDTYSDYHEVKIYNSNPMKTNINFIDDDISYITNDDNFVSRVYQYVYEDKWGGWAEQSRVWIGSHIVGNHIIGSKQYTQYLYEAALMDYLKNYVNESKEEHELIEFMTEADELISFMLQSVEMALENIDDYDEETKEYLINLKQQIKITQKNMYKLKNENVVKNGMTPQKYYETFSYTYELYKKGLPKINKLKSEMKIFKKIQKAYNGAYSTLKELNETLDGLMIFFNLIKTGYETYEKCSQFYANIEQMLDCIKILEIIKNSNDANDYLKQACTELIDAISEQYFDVWAKVRNNVALEAGNQILDIAVDKILPHIPYVGPALDIAKKSLGIFDFMFNISDVSDARVYLYAISKSSCIISEHFKNNILKSPKSYSYYHVYNQCSNYCKDMKNEYFALVMLKKQSELNMRQANEANSFLAEWLFRDILYKDKYIELNLKKLSMIRFNYSVILYC